MSLGVLQAIEAAGIPDGQILVTGQDVELVGDAGDRRGPPVRQRLAGARRDGGAGAEVAVALANCEPFERRRPSTTARRDIPFVETPIYPGDRGRWRNSPAPISTGRPSTMSTPTSPIRCRTARTIPAMEMRENQAEIAWLSPRSPLRAHNQASSRASSPSTM